MATRTATTVPAGLTVMPLLDIAPGGALVGLRELLPEPDEEFVSGLDTQRLREAMAKGGGVALAEAIISLRASSVAVLDRFSSAALAKAD